MPELPEVETTRRGLLPLLGQAIKRVIVRNPSLRWPVPAELAQVLPGQRFQSLTRRAKYILAQCDNGTLLLHLGMSGRICLLEKDEPAGKHDHFDIHFADGHVLRLRDPRRFGAVLWMNGETSEHVLLSKLGPEPLEEMFDSAWLYRNIRSRTAPIKNVI
ncbi:MAG TPA: DNA-formamidopyrimidine glycosylase family protein, partial [Methylophilaceae bacterium]|nr:DNA-formamidopyrimidine glycosylase family protein [Methylophilaceae bacterium]